MTRITVQVDEDHLERLIRSPLHGLAELLWNALDADATRVDAEVIRNHLGGIDSVVVSDDGLGMTVGEARQAFGALGGSWKRRDRLTRRDRRVLHGDEGKGRYSAFSIGEHVRWSSVAALDDGSHEQITISGTRSALRIFDIPDGVRTEEQTGTKVIINGVNEKAGNVLDRDTVADDLTVTLALYLESYPVTVQWRGQSLSPKLLQEHRAVYSVDVPGTDEQVTLTVIEWTKPVRRALLLCDANGMTLHELQPGIQAPGFDFTAYIRWDGFRDLGHDLLLAELGHSELTPILEVARNVLRRHFKARIEDKQRELIQRWKDEQTYPYSGEPRDTVEQAERELFDVVVLAAADAVDTTDRTSRKLSLRLIKEALESSPTGLGKILTEVLELPTDRLEELERLLDRTPLASMIAASKTIADRLDFISGLDVMLFDAGPKQQTLERRQLHRILVEETWIFGEEYALTGDDQRLTTVLAKHLALLGEDVELADAAPVLREDGRDAIIDLVLSRIVQHHQNELEHLVVELKRPSVQIGSHELQQIEDYAFAVAGDERFSQPNVRWEFWIIGNEITDSTRRRATQAGRPLGLIHEDTRIRIWAKTWAEVIGDAKHRLKFVEASLRYRTTRERGIAYLHETHSKYLPASLHPTEDEHQA